MAKRPKRPRDPNQLAKMMIDVASGDVASDATHEAGKDPAAVALGRKGGKIGGVARAANMTAEQREEAARLAASARWRKRH